MTSSQLNFNFLHNLRHWSDALAKIAHQMPHMESHFRDSLASNHMEACIWAVDELKKIIDGGQYLKTEQLHVMILHSWLGIPLVPLLCENLNVTTLTLVDLDKDANELARIFNRHYTNEQFVKTHVLTLDVPFAIHQLNGARPDVVISLHCEQMYPLADLVVNNPFALYVMQSSAVPEEALGINTVASADELRAQVQLPTVHMSGMKLQEMYTWQGRKFYERYQVIGTREIPDTPTV